MLIGLLYIWYIEKHKSDELINAMKFQFKIVNLSHKYFVLINFWKLLLPIISILK